MKTVPPSISRVEYVFCCATTRRPANQDFMISSRQLFFLFSSSSFLATAALHAIQLKMVVHISIDLKAFDALERVHTAAENCANVVRRDVHMSIVRCVQLDIIYRLQ